MFELGLGLKFEKMFDSGLARKSDLVFAREYAL